MYIKVKRVHCVDSPENNPCVLQIPCVAGAQCQAQGGHTANVFSIKERMGKESQEAKLLSHIPMNSS